MPIDQSRAARPWYFAALAVLLAMLFCNYDADILRALGVNAWFEAFPYGWPLLLNTLDLLVIFLSFWLIGGVAPAQQWGITGLAKPIVPALVFGAILFVPVVIALLLLTSPADSISVGDIVFGGLMFPLFEEIMFRGIAIGVLMRHFRWPFLLAALLPSIFFGLFHMYQGDGLEESLGIAAITGIGGIWFGWVYWKWDFNLWPAFFLHAGLNLLWSLFDLGENAMGGQLGNIMRIIIIAGSIILTLRGRALIDKLLRRQNDAAPAI
ncbi:MAG: CPBP family intramembrane glutamic endopeptidase [Pseudomonadota bacterium]